ncbi:TetR/AcrR family transcriptional regulator [Aquabacterium sp. J223]|uniref:TetR/AcrR family transcriptional regulator n=1 Tax=Aquabacterium sp. J223 TaxID=2898431 RepID=UPI0021AE064F|nr:TetR/AcrR family transcriptional regulator [Aquabacterium sp. J223]UUX94005.1 TetR/AcrR family transcriptional regulator [Aquabacterium sp. J223]
MKAGAKPPTVVEADAPPRAPLTPQDWVDAALDLMVDHGIDAVRVDVLAKRIGVTRGSFYWHFRDRDDLLAAVLRHWQQVTTDRLIDRWAAALAAGQTDAQQVRELMTLPRRGRTAARAARIELAMRAWARRDSAARKALDEIDGRRIDWGTERFRALGFDDSEARARSFLLYAYQVTESLVPPRTGAAERDERARRIERLLLAGPVG